MKEKDTLQITIKKQKIPKSKIGKWLFWNIYWTIWCIWRPKFIAWSCWNIYHLFTTKKMREKIDNEEYDIIIKNDDEKSKSIDFSIFHKDKKKKK